MEKDWELSLSFGILPHDMNYLLYYTHFEISGDPYNLIYSRIALLFGSKSHPFLKMKMK